MNKKRLVITILIITLLFGVGGAVLVRVQNNNQKQEEQKELPVTNLNIQEDKIDDEGPTIPNNTTNEEVLDKSEIETKVNEKQDGAGVQEEKQKSKVIDLPLVPIERLRQLK